jgi:hypothetical protein
MVHGEEDGMELLLLERLDRALSRYAAVPPDGIREMHLSADRLRAASYDRSAEPEYVRALTAFSAFVLN